jgi:cytochrome c oxidase subunit 3
MTSATILQMALGFILYFHYYNVGHLFILITFISLPFCLYGWFSDVIMESTIEGNHTKAVQANINFGMVLFITSEVMFFFAFFWSFFHFSLSPSIWIGSI